MAGEDSAVWGHVVPDHLFSIRELWTLKKQKPYLQWGKRRHQKEELLKRSRRWRALRSGVALLLAVLVVGVPVGLVQMLSPSFLLEEEAQAMIVENGYYDITYNRNATGIQHQYEVKTVKGDQIVGLTRPPGGPGSSRARPTL